MEEFFIGQSGEQKSAEQRSKGKVKSYQRGKEKIILKQASQFRKP